MSTNPLRVAIIGTNGCAESHHRALAILESEGLCQVVGTCDPWAYRTSRPWHVKPELRIHSDHHTMLVDLAGQVDYVTVPTPIHLHGDMHRDVIGAGHSCYLEKPPTLDPQELMAMLRVEATAPKSSFIGFSHLFRPDYGQLKQRIHGGDFGCLREIRFLGMWPRTRAYFRRNLWAGCLEFEGRIVLDSCLGNGMAHHVHNCLFWSGLDGIWAWDEPSRVKAQLFRVNQIEGPDAIFLEAEGRSGVPIRMALTHASCISRTEEILYCDDATIRITYGLNPRITIEWSNGPTEPIALAEKDGYAENHRWFGEYLRGLRDRPCTTLVDCRGLVHLNALAYLSAGCVIPVAEIDVEAFCRNGDEGLQIVGFEEKAMAYLTTGELPDFFETPVGVSSWVDERHLPLLAPTITKIAMKAREDSGNGYHTSMVRSMRLKTEPLIHRPQTVPAASGSGLG